VADVDEVVGDHPKADPALHSGGRPVSASIESVPAFDHANALLTSGPPLLAVAEPPLLLLTLALGVFGGGIGDADAFDAFGFGCRLVLAE
jgi:hypothetical protein